MGLQDMADSKVEQQAGGTLALIVCWKMSSATNIPPEA